MNAKRWFAWVCLALMLVAEFCLFRSNHERDAALTELKTTQQQLQDTKNELDALKSSGAGAQAAENAGLRRQNDLLSAKVNALQKNLDHLQMESQQNAQHLSTARSALELQQEHLQQLQAEQQQAAAAANLNACINNLRQIDAAKQQWALEKGKSATDVPSAQDLTPYLKDGTFPSCPEGGTYSINSMAELPTCTQPGHALTAQ